MLKNKVKIIITAEPNESQLIESGILRITYPYKTEDIIIVGKHAYKEICACIYNIKKIDKKLTSRLILTCGDCYFPADEIPTSNPNVYLNLNQFLERHAYIKNLHDKFESSQSHSLIQYLIDKKSDKDCTL